MESSMRPSHFLRRRSAESDVRRARQLSSRPVVASLRRTILRMSAAASQASSSIVGLGRHPIHRVIAIARAPSRTTRGRAILTFAPPSRHPGLPRPLMAALRLGVFVVLVGVLIVGTMLGAAWLANQGLHHVVGGH